MRSNLSCVHRKSATVKLKGTQVYNTYKKLNFALPPQKKIIDGVFSLVSP